VPGHRRSPRLRFCAEHARNRSRRLAPAFPVFAWSLALIGLDREGERAGMGLATLGQPDKLLAVDSDRPVGESVGLSRPYHSHRSALIRVHQRLKSFDLF
jgi:hypothetical protein